MSKTSDELVIRVDELEAQAAYDQAVNAQLTEEFHKVSRDRESLGMECDRLKSELRMVRSDVDAMREERDRALRQAKGMRDALEHVIEVASGRRQVADDDLGGIVYIDNYARSKLNAA